jgi:hypothetical protein
LSAPQGSTPLWWRTAAANSRLLASTINQQIVATVEKEIAAIDTEARSAHAAIRTLFYQHVLETREADKREFVFLAQLQAHPTLSWIAFGWPDGSFFAAHKLGDERLEMMEISMVDGALKRRIDRYLVVVGDIEFEERSFEPTTYKVAEQDWFRSALAADGPRWFDVSVHPNGTHPAIAFAGPIDVYQKREGVLPSSSSGRACRVSSRSLRLGRPARPSSWDRTGPSSPCRMPKRTSCTWNAPPRKSCCRSRFVPRPTMPVRTGPPTRGPATRCAK